ncbi:MAG: hypothetical protein N3F03_07010 [Ignavibacteria bacterium]|nr:hypothetical protein [Ignavibacteria bacterium]
MGRLILFLIIMYIIYRVVRFFSKAFSTNYPARVRKRQDREIIDVDYEEVKSEDNSEKVK